MKAELQDKDARLTDAQLQSLATKHQMEQMKQLLISMKVCELYHTLYCIFTWTCWCWNQFGKLEHISVM